MNMKKKEMAQLFDILGGGSVMDEVNVREIRIADAAISVAFAYCSDIAAERGLVLVGDDGKVDRNMTLSLLVREAFGMLAKDSE